MTQPVGPTGLPHCTHGSAGQRGSLLFVDLLTNQRSRDGCVADQVDVVVEVGQPARRRTTDLLQAIKDGDVGRFKTHALVSRPHCCGLEHVTTPVAMQIATLADHLRNAVADVSW